MGKIMDKINMEGKSDKKKFKVIMIAFVLLMVFGIVFGTCTASEAEFKTEYINNQMYLQPEYVNTGGYYNIDSYNNVVNYVEEFIAGEERSQMVQRTDRNGNTVQAVVPVGVPETEINTDTKIEK